MYNLSVIMSDPLVPSFKITFKPGYLEINFCLISWAGLVMSIPGSILRS